MTESRTAYVAGVLTVLAVVMLLAWRRRRRRRLRAKPPVAQASFTFPAERSDSSREWMIAWSVALRESLAARFGPAWLAKTTEEIAGDAALPSVLGQERASWLVDFLAAADRAKFADSGHDVEGPADSELRELAEFIAARGG